MAVPLETGDGRRGLGALLRDLASDAANLVRCEWRLAQEEVGRAAAGVGSGIALVATGALVALLGMLSLIVGGVLLIGDQWLPADLYWVAALIVLVITGAVAAWLARRGMKLLSPSHLAPRESMASLKEDKEWMKQRLTSDATSN